MQARPFLIPLSLVLGLQAAHASVSVQCSAPNLVQCVVSDPQGIRKVTVRAESSGTVLVDTSYACVSTATVAFDGATRSSQLDVTTCGGDGVPPKPAAGYGDPAYTYTLSDGVIVRDESPGSLDLARPGLVYVARFPLRLAELAQVRQVLQLPNVLLGFLAPGANPLATTYYCCTGSFTCVPVNPLAVCGAGLTFWACDGNGCKVYPN